MARFSTRLVTILFLSSISPFLGATPVAPNNRAFSPHVSRDTCPPFVPWLSPHPPEVELKQVTVSASVSQFTDEGKDLGQLMMTVNVQDTGDGSLLGSKSIAFPLVFSNPGLCWPRDDPNQPKFSVSSDKFRYEIIGDACTPGTIDSNGLSDGFNFKYADACWVQPWGGESTKPDSILTFVNKAQTLTTIRVWKYK